MMLKIVERSLTCALTLGKKWDSNGDYIRRYVPELKDFSNKYIYEPHKAPIQDQKKAGVLVDGDGSEVEKDGLKLYPKRIFDFNERRDICMQGMKNAYHVGLYGNNAKVLDGTWKELFDDDTERPTAGAKGGPAGLSAPDGTSDDEQIHDVKSPDTSKASPRGHKREHSQTKLDFKKKSKK